MVEESCDLSSPVQGQLECKGRVVHTLLLKCRDRDKRVQLSAYEQLASMDSKVLHEHMRPLHWRAVLDAGLGVGDGAQLTQGETPPPQWAVFFTCIETGQACASSALGRLAGIHTEQGALKTHQADALPECYRRRPWSLGKPQLTKVRPLLASVRVQDRNRGKRVHFSDVQLIGLPAETDGKVLCNNMKPFCYQDVPDTGLGLWGCTPLTYRKGFPVTFDIHVVHGCVLPAVSALRILLPP